MKPSNAEKPAPWLFASDFDADIARRAQSMVERLAGSGSVPDYLSDGDKKRFGAARKIVMTEPTNKIAETLYWYLFPVTILCVGSIFITFIHGFIHSTIARDLPLPLFLGVFCLLAHIGLGRWNSRQEPKRGLSPRAIALALPLLNHGNPAEKAYCEAAASLLQEKPSAWGGSQTIKNLLHDLRDLYQTGKQAAARRAEIEQVMSRQTLADVDAEAARLSEKAEAAKDGHAREIWEQSLDHLRARRARIEKMEPLRERLEAQEEAVLQALREAHVSFADTHSFGWGIDDALHSNRAPVETGLSAPWNETARRLRRQTESVEKAVQEVIGGAGGTKSARR